MEAPAPSIKPIVGILTARRDLLAEVLEELARTFGPADIVGDWRPFDHTDYYRDEMGDGLWRCFVSFEQLLPPEAAISHKAAAHEVEQRSAVAGRRTVNLDPGFLDANKVVLLSGKHGGHKIALAAGLYADLLLWYDRGWKALPWAFPDFRDGGYFADFLKMRSEFKRQFKALRRFPLQSAISA